MYFILLFAGPSHNMRFWKFKSAWWGLTYIEKWCDYMSFALSCGHTISSGFFSAQIESDEMNKYIGSMYAYTNHRRLKNICFCIWQCHHHRRVMIAVLDFFAILTKNWSPLEAKLQWGSLQMSCHNLISLSFSLSRYVPQNQKSIIFTEIVAGHNREMCLHKSKVGHSSFSTMFKSEMSKWAHSTHMKSWTNTKHNLLFLVPKYWLLWIYVKRTINSFELVQKEKKKLAISKRDELKCEWKCGEWMDTNLIEFLVRMYYQLFRRYLR
jgi:hypothetical protein